MNLQRLRIRKAIVCLLATAFLVVSLPLTGCGKKEKTPEEIEKSRIEHGQRAQRELEEG